MIIENAKYVKDTDGVVNCIRCTVNEKTLLVPTTDTANTDYAEILKQVDEGTITIAEAD